MDIRGGAINGVDVIGNPPLYGFTTWTFTNANSTGQFGPTIANLRAIYNTTGNTWINNDTYFTSVAGIQYWTVPTTGTYTITAAGAVGGGNIGLGALISGNTTLYRGETIQIVVGQRGANVTTSYGSGGGGSFVVRAPFNSNVNIIAIAGGGGGKNGLSANSFNSGGNVAVTPGSIPAYLKSTGGGGGGGSNVNGGLNGAAGADQSTGGYPGGGGGFFGNGGGSTGYTVGGRSFRFGANGGPGGSGSESVGGFGAGGGGSARGAGGGGYNGGNAGDAGQTYSGAGGGSYTLNLTGVSATGNTILGNGYVTITLVSTL